MESIFRLGFALGIFSLMVIWELISPRRKLSLSRKQRWPVNLGLALSNILLTRFTVGAITFLTAIYAQEQGLGLLNLVTIPNSLAIIITLFSLDFAIYFQHIISHKWAWLWRFHQVHHSDIDIDVTTAVRFHPVEIGLSLIYKLIWILLLGANPIAVIAFEIILNGTATFNHSNVNIPLKIDKALRWLIVTPDMHRIHHSTLRIEADSNYGFSISLWDRVFKTYTEQPKDSQQTMDIGLKNLRKPRQVSFLKLLSLPIKEFR
ncbi:MAG: sterol desaturase family protein [Methylococcaceae bacterium]|nr:sterol desaturase family protein [Methylococcaceae bacterium]